LQLSARGDLRIADDKSVLLDPGTNIVVLCGAFGLELDRGIPFVQTDIDLLDTMDLLHGHAHGVGADGSIHPKDRDVHLLDLGAGASREEQCKQYGCDDRAFHL
jgi:hypothetical protein